MPARTIRLWLFLILLPMTQACGAGSAASGSGRNPNMIGNWELQELSDQNVLDAIRQLRPAWLRARTRPSIAAGETAGYPRVHLNGVPLGDIRELETIRVDEVRELHYMSGPDASTRWGTDYTNGVILVTMER